MWYFIHQTSDELLRSAVEVVNFILYDIVPRDVMKTKKKTLEEDKSSVSIKLLLLLLFKQTSTKL